MSEAENLLNTLSDEGVSATATTEEHIVVNADRTVTVPESLRDIAVQFDHNIETVTFDCPRYWDGNDLSVMSIYINYKRPDNKLGCALMENVTVDETDDSIMHFDWTISGDVTAVKGNISFLVCAKQTNIDGEEELHWNSKLNQQLVISEGLECTQSVIERSPDIITQLLLRMELVEAAMFQVGTIETLKEGEEPYVTSTPVKNGDGSTTHVVNFGIPSGKDGHPGVYVGGGDMPEGYTVQVVPNGSALKFSDDFTLNEAGEIALKIPMVAQGPGESTSLAMSQKAVTNLVSDALGTNEEVVYEEVDSVNEMTDTSKSYVLKSTGTIWVYGEAGLQPTWTKNYANPSDQYWLQDTRLNSSNTTSCPGMTTTNYIDTKDGDIVRVANFNLDANLGDSSKVGAVSQYAQNNLSVCNSRHPTRSSNIFISEASGVYSFQGISGYLRFCGVPTDGDENVIITINEEIAYTTGYAWYDTRLTPSASGGNGNYVDLVVKINENKAYIEEISGRVTSLETGNGSATIPSFWKDAVDICVSKIKALQVNRNCVTFPFFSDNHTRDGHPQYMGMLIAHVMNECGIPYCFCGGDAITSAMASTADSDAEFRAMAKAFDKAMSYIPDGKFFMALGNHETWLAANPNIEGSTRVDYGRNEQYNIFLRNKLSGQNAQVGGDGTYYYVDDNTSKVRWIVLNTNGINNNRIDNEQLSWFENTALKFTESGWGVVIISHIPITNHYEQSNIANNTDAINVVKRYMSSSSEHKADIIGWYSGHIHRDRIYTGVSVNDTDDSVGSDMGFKQITITSDHTGIAYPLGTSPAYHAIANDDKSHAIDFVTINKSTRTVYITRLGIGSDRQYTY